jgi:CHAT domain-containing protein
MLSGDDATQSRFVAAAVGSALIHYAGHADSNAGNSYGALLFTASGGDSGVLTTSDIAQLALIRHPLVVLAACGTFRGDSVHVGGMSSLARAFLLAGARAVAGTLWEVDDDVAARLFLKLHEHLRAGESPARAVRAAQIEMIHASDPRSRHPATWAPVELLSRF